MELYLDIYDKHLHQSVLCEVWREAYLKTTWMRFSTEHSQEVSYLYHNFKVHFPFYKNLAVLPSQHSLDCQGNPFSFPDQTF